MELKQRIGIDLGRKIRLEDGIEWAATNDVRFIDCELDVAPNSVLSFDDARSNAVRGALERHGIELGLHTLSAVNVAEYSPFVGEAVDHYLKAYVDAARRLGAGWVVVHGGYHFTGDYKARVAAAIERLKRTVAYAEARGVKLLLENLNKEPADAEVHYLCFDLEECRNFFGQISSPHLGWSFTVNHAHMVAGGIDGHIDGLDMSRLGEVRLADNRGDREEHLRIGEGNIDFRRMFRRIEEAGYRGHYMNAFGSLDDMLKGRDVLAELARTT
ncbi:MAG: sugar phosphate isomerase/epimerase [Alphaproteobacteria bacterium]|nr:sugar phosphate isomerase/epimerase [Alphaproteobacteria bacterium]